MRLKSIDVFRALTMLLMIFVNDLWTLKDIPEWLEHVGAKDDGMGLADVVFPAFVFIIGLSVPLAIDARVRAGDTSQKIAAHILLRSLALILMGVFHVNLENYGDAAVLPQPVFQIIITIAFFMIWLDYPKDWKPVKYILQASGICLLIAMAVLYRGEDGGGMRPHWWGILGLIGWTYLIVSFIALVFRERILIHTLWLLFFIALSAAAKLGWLESTSSVRNIIWIVSDGALPALAMAGIISTLVMKAATREGNPTKLVVSLSTFATGMFLFGFITRPLWGISKIGATPSWVAICAAISICMTGMLWWLVDIKGKASWFKLIAPAGTSTLTCYLFPYLHYALYSIIGISLPVVLRTGTPGIIKSLGYALLIIIIAGLLEKRRLRLKL